jgi:hypothetical protein
MEGGLRRGAYGAERAPATLKAGSQELAPPIIKSVKICLPSRSAREDFRSSLAKDGVNLWLER